MPQLDNYLVTLGMKGQNLVLATMDNIRKKGRDLSKKQIVKMSPALDKGNAYAAKEKGQKSLPDLDYDRKGLVVSKEKKSSKKDFAAGSSPADKKEESNAAKFNKAANKFGEGVKSFAGAASTLDPTTTISGVTSAIGTALSGISVLGVSLGRLPEGIAAIANSTLSMAKNSVDMAKQATAAFYNLTTRNAAASYYGEKVTTKGPMSRNERAMFIDAISGSMGKIGQPLADEINKLVGKKDTRALARVGAGDWESTGTDKGWMLGQVSNSFQGLPPSIKQKFQASLLSKNAGEIQDMAPGQKGVQRNAGELANIEEDQTQRVYNRSLGANGETNKNVIGAISKMNSLQVTLYDTGLTFASTMNKAITALTELPATIDNMQKAMKKFVDDPGMRSARELMKSIKVGK